MYRQSPARGQRSKGIGVKHVLQFSLLLGVCFWLLYQLKHSHEKNIQIEKSEAKGLLENLRTDEILKLGRKGITDRFQETVSMNVKYDANEEETSGGEDDNKFEEVGLREDEGEADEGEGGGDETEKNEQEGSDAEMETDEEMPTGEKVDDEEAESNEEQEETLVEGTDQEGENISVPEARENHYKADDVSSAVTHDSQTGATENENENENEISQENEQPITDSEERNDGVIPEETSDETIKDLAQEVIGSENGDQLENENHSPPNATVTQGSSDHILGNFSTDLANENETGNNETTRSMSENNDEADDPELQVRDGSDLHMVTSDSSNSTGSGEARDSLNETVLEDMVTTDVFSKSLIKDNSTPKNNDEEEDESKTTTLDTLPGTKVEKLIVIQKEP